MKKRKRNKRKKGKKKKKPKMISLTFFIVILKKRLKYKKRKKERKNESYDLWLERERKRKQTSCRESRLTSQRNGYFSFWVCLLDYVSFKSTLTATRKRGKVRESPIINDTDNLIFQIILSLQHENCVVVFYYNNIWDTFHLLFILFRF